jgi:hypothetical protein
MPETSAGLTTVDVAHTLSAVRATTMPSKRAHARLAELAYTTDALPRGR